MTQKNGLRMAFRCPDALPPKVKRAARSRKEDDQVHAPASIATAGNRGDHPHSLAADNDGSPGSLDGTDAAVRSALGAGPQLLSFPPAVPGRHRGVPAGRRDLYQTGLRPTGRATGPPALRR